MSVRESAFVRRAVRASFASSGPTFIVATALLAWLAPGAALVAQDRRPGGPERVEVQILAIRATNANSEISSDLKDIAAQLKEKFRFTGFKLEKRATQSIEPGRDYTSLLIGEYSARVRPVRRLESNRIQVEIELLRRVGQEDKSLQKTTVTMDAGKFLFFGGMRLGQGDELIAAVSAR
jgi:hypothetical protein